MTDSPQLQQSWVRIVPHVIDTILLLSAIVLAILIAQYSFVHSWVTAKVILLAAYIGLGMVALKWRRTCRVRVTAWIGALVIFGYIVLIAHQKSIIPV